MSEQEFYVKFWGVRGSLPSPGPHTVEFGGNTPCVEIRCGDKLLVFDAGSGIMPFGNSLCEEKIKKLDLFFSHYHYDHIVGLPFFAPFYRSDTHIRVWAGHEPQEKSARSVFEAFMKPPFFPVPPKIFHAELDYKDFEPGDELDMGDGVKIETTALNHPGGAVGYRVNYQGKSICYVTDTEHVPGHVDENILHLIRNADVMIYDASFSDENFSQYKGFGHSTWQEGARLCEAANVKTYVIFHHMPSATDSDLLALETKAKKMFANAMVAREGAVIAP